MNNQFEEKVIGKWANRIGDDDSQALRHFAKLFYRDLPVHNYEHGLWVSNKAIEIAKTLPRIDYEVLIPMSALHDIGAPWYSHHPEIGGYFVDQFLRDFMQLDEEKIEYIAEGIREHDGDRHTFDESKILYDADTLNKAGAHGIRQFGLVAKEWEMSLTDLAKRAAPKFLEKAIKGYYYSESVDLDLGMGGGESGLWETHRILKDIASKS